MRLSDLQTGQTAIVLKVLGYGGFRRRVMEMGFVRGKRVEVILNAPLRDPIKYKIMDYEVSLRRSEAQMVEVITEAEAQDMINQLADRHVMTEEEQIEQVISTRRRVINIALVGNPNSGKTSLFNALSGGHEHVGNYSGVTVDAKSGTFRYKGYRFNITDLPGTYALSAYSPEEIYVRRHLVDNTPDIVINAVVASNLERNLYLTTELIDINPNMVVALNMYDELERRGDQLDYEQLGAMLGVPMVPVVARDGRGLDQLLQTVIDVYENRDSRVRHIHINHGAVVESGIEALKAVMRPVRDQLPKHFPPRYWAIKLLERDKEAEQTLQSIEGYSEWIAVRDREVERIERQLGEDVEMAVTSEKYGFIAGALRETYQKGEQNPIETTTIIDTIVTHRVFGFPIFFLLMWLMFAATFSLGAYPQDWIEAGVNWLAEWVGGLMEDGALKDLIVNGIIGGVGSVIVFLPNILILYLFISLMEDSGYMARAAFIMDKLMHRIGLHGKSFIPLLMSFGCNVPAIMACRTIESRSSRIITILISPFMSCSARLPIYILLVGTFFPSYASLVLIGLYILGVIVAIITAKLMRRYLYPVDETPFVMELPPYRVPTLQATLRHMWEKAVQYLRKMGGVILVGSLIIWFLSYYPRPEHTGTTAAATTEQSAPDYSHSYLGQIGRLCEPVMEPIGLNWKGGVAILSGAAAKEIVVSTLGVLYAEESLPANQDELSEEASLGAKLVASGDFDTRTALAFMVFILLYFPCVATLIAIAKETGRWYWAAVTVLYNTAVAWVAAYITYLIGGLF
ncbi:MAG: ferrous iron transport protein B [Rikenellaceae bacterium]|nr:ferrous iron transport protein B [Rikenellaceae bacterium]MBP3683114.1 ferrous iron transport protein B [Rikenellaceae bacterium]